MATQTVTGPTRKPRLYDLRSVMEFEEDSRLGAFQAVTYDPEPCGTPRTTIALCWEDQAEKGEKTGDGTDWANAIMDPFVQYAGVSCYMGEGQDFADRARAILDGGDDDEIGGRIAAWAIANGQAVDVGAKLGDALANVEQAIRAGYLGQGIILVNARTATILGESGGLSAKDGILQTPLGTPIAVSSEVGVGVVIGLGATKVVHSPTREHEANDHRNNTALAIAERIYTVLVDCDFAVHASPLT